jgi:hypothetical protein
MSATNRVDSSASHRSFSSERQQRTLQHEHIRKLPTHRENLVMNDYSRRTNTTVGMGSQEEHGIRREQNSQQLDEMRSTDLHLGSSRRKLPDTPTHKQCPVVINHEEPVTRTSTQSQKPRPEKRLDSALKNSDTEPSLSHHFSRATSVNECDLTSVPQSVCNKVDVESEMKVASVISDMQQSSPIEQPVVNCPAVHTAPTQPPIIHIEQPVVNCPAVHTAPTQSPIILIEQPVVNVPQAFPANRDSEPNAPKIKHSEPPIWRHYTNNAKDIHTSSTNTDTGEKTDGHSIHGEAVKKTTQRCYERPVVRQISKH